MVANHVTTLSLKKRSTKARGCKFFNKNLEFLPSFTFKLIEKNLNEGADEGAKRSVDSSFYFC